ncbi:hypothetical protein N7490_005274 [Penicillium lividum]|nr:hypothetical protein N7490_005274 [Penicillium lividum]
MRPFTNEDHHLLDQRNRYPIRSSKTPAKTRARPRRINIPSVANGPRPPERHCARPCASLSTYPPAPDRPRKLGNLAEILCFCLEKNPLLRVEKDGYPRTSSLFAFAAAQDIPGDLEGEYPRGVVVPLPGAKPGLDHPPPGWGEGDRDSDMGCDRWSRGKVEGRKWQRGDCAFGILVTA